VNSKRTLSEWHIITGEFPPDGGGVADYTAQLAHGLAAEGSPCRVWTAGQAVDADAGFERVAVQRLKQGFGASGLRRLGQELDRRPRPRRLLVQYVPHAFGGKAMNLAFAAWVWRRKWLAGDDVSVMFHEVTFPFVRAPLKHNLIAVVNRLMAALLLAASNRVYVSTPAWTPLLRSCGWRGDAIWLPIPSNIPVVESDDAVGCIRRRLVGAASDAVVGHFGTYPPIITQLLVPTLRRLLTERPRLTVLLLGRCGPARRDELLVDYPEKDWRVVAPGELTAEELSLHLQACDVLLQPFPDGATTRRTSLMAGLAHGVPTVTTLGVATEPIWQTDEIASATPVGDIGALVDRVKRLIDDPVERMRVGQRSKAYYDAHFAIEHTVARLLNAQPELDAHLV
jgi:glycosyltransferase involved in cell wall biosynthesis